MPWDVRKQGDGTWCVFKKTDGSKVACHDSQAQARAQVRALYAAEADASSSLMDARELNLFVVAARERDVNIPGGGGHDLLNYWTKGPGAAKIVWGTDGSFARCVAQLGKYVKKPQGLCAEYHKAATGEWPAEKGVPSAGGVIELADGLLDYFDAETLEFAVSSQFAADIKSDVEDADRRLATGKREETALTATHEFHGNHNQQDHGNWADDFDAPTRAGNVKRLAELEDKADSDEGLNQRESDELKQLRKKYADERPSTSSNVLSTWDDIDEARRSVKPGQIFAQGDDPDGAYKVRLKRVAGEEDSVLSEVSFDSGKTWKPAESENGDGVISFDDIESDITWRRFSTQVLTAATSGKKKSCPPGQHMMLNGTCMDDDEMKNSKDMPMKPDMMEYADEPWEGVLVVEGSESGDGRLFALGSLDWAQLPLPLMYQPANVGGHSGSFAVGEITHVARRGNELYGWGNIFGSTLSGDHGEGIRNVMKVGGVSVDVDAVKDADVEMVYADDESGPNPFAKPETTIFHRGRVRGATLVAFPAFVEAKLRFTGALTAAASCGCGDAGELADEATELLVASVADDTTHTITIPNLPPPHWFAEPTDVEATGALTITDEGRIFAIVAPANVTHRSVKTKVPRNLDFSRFHKAETIVRGGDRVVTGVITANCGHAATENYGTLARRREHYDNSCSVLANVRVGYSRNGNIWAAGALNPGASAEQVAQALGCTLSLDVQPHPDRPGVREFIAAHLVPVPGFPLARTRPSATYSDGVLSAAALPVSYVDKPQPRRVDAAVTLEFVTRAKNAVATQLGFDATSRKRELARQLELT